MKKILIVATLLVSFGAQAEELSKGCAAHLLSNKTLVKKSIANIRSRTIPMQNNDNALGAESQLMVYSMTALDGGLKNLESGKALTDSQIETMNLICLGDKLDADSIMFSIDNLSN